MAVTKTMTSLCTEEYFKRIKSRKEQSDRKGGQIPLLPSSWSYADTSGLAVVCT